MLHLLTRNQSTHPARGEPRHGNRITQPQRELWSAARANLGLLVNMNNANRPTTDHWTGKKVGKSTDGRSLQNTWKETEQYLRFILPCFTWEKTVRRKECHGLDSSPFSHSVPHILKTESKARLSLGVLLVGTQTKISPHSLMFQHPTLNVMVHTLHYSLQVFRGPRYCAPHQLPSPHISSPSSAPRQHPYIPALLPSLFTAGPECKKREGTWEL